MGGRNPGSWHRAQCMVDDHMARSKVYCSFGEGTARHRAQCMEHRAVHMALYTCCEHSGSHMVSYREGNHECKAPCTCGSKSRDAHTGENMGNGTVLDNTCYRYRDMHGHILADDYKGSYIQDPLSVVCKSKHLAGCGHTSVLS